MSIMVNEVSARPRREPLPRWTVPAVAGAVLLVCGVVFVLLWCWVSKTGLSGRDLTTAQLEVVKVVSGIAVGGGGLFALYLAARRQRTQELELAQREDAHALAVQIALHTEKDAEARRVTELYAKAVEQTRSGNGASATSRQAGPTGGGPAPPSRRVVPGPLAHRPRSTRQSAVSALTDAERVLGPGHPATRTIRSNIDEARST